MNDIIDTIEHTRNYIAHTPVCHDYLFEKMVDLKWQKDNLNPIRIRLRNNLIEKRLEEKQYMELMNKIESIDKKIDTALKEIDEKDKYSDSESD